MSGETAVVTGKPYGLERVCRVLAFPRSTIYGQRQRESAKVVPLFPVRRGPKPKVPDADLLAALRADLQASPVTGEGHRTIWARLRILIEGQNRALQDVVLQTITRLRRSGAVKLAPAASPPPAVQRPPHCGKTHGFRPWRWLAAGTLFGLGATLTTTLATWGCTQIAGR